MWGETGSHVEGEVKKDGYKKTNYKCADRYVGGEEEEGEKQAH